MVLVPLVGSMTVVCSSTMLAVALLALSMVMGVSPVLVRVAKAAVISPLLALIQASSTVSGALPSLAEALAVELVLALAVLVAEVSALLQPVSTSRAIAGRVRAGKNFCDDMVLLLRMREVDGLLTLGLGQHDDEG